ncbi:hypothetical protein [Pectobacterium aroidearum]|uniref:hypothetical protein n=1 Tax=Pectobacterium aroidearum TaxID=1201031 RepID=UPI00331517E8
MSSKNHELLLHVESAKLISYQLEAVLSVWLESLPEKNRRKRRGQFSWCRLIDA